MDEKQSVGSAVGENIRRLRDERQFTQEELSLYCRLVGLDWTRDVIASIESGRREDFTVRELLLLASVFDARPAVFFEGEGRLSLGDTPDAQVSITRSALRSWLSRVSRPRVIGLAIPRAAERANAARKVLALDLRLAERFGFSFNEWMNLTSQLWGQTATEERGRRTSMREIEASGGDPVLALHHPKLQRSAVRGHVTRELIHEIELALERGPGAKKRSKR